MIIAGFQKNSLVDYAGKVSAVVFTPYCNFDCYYCHNRMLLERDPEKAQYQVYPEEEILEFLDRRKGLLQGLCITGGEPTLQPDLQEFINKVKAKGFPVKLDSNGTNPTLIRKLIEEGSIDYIAMDIKAPWDRYDEICGVKTDHDAIRESISIIRESGIGYEFRTTVPPDYTLDDIRGVVEIIKGSKFYVLQQFRKPNPVPGFVDIRNQHKPHLKPFFLEAKAICEQYIDRVMLRGVKG